MLQRSEEKLGEGGVFDSRRQANDQVPATPVMGKITAPSQTPGFSSLTDESIAPGGKVSMQERHHHVVRDPFIDER